MEYERLYQKLMNAGEDICRFLENAKDNPVCFSEVPDQGIKTAVKCAAFMQRTGTYRGEKIGLVNPDIPELFQMGTLRRNQVVLYQDEHDGTVTVKVPFSIENIIQQEKKQSLISSSTIINVPSNYIRELIP